MTPLPEKFRNSRPLKDRDRVQLVLWHGNTNEWFVHPGFGVVLETRNGARVRWTSNLGEDCEVQLSDGNIPMSVPAFAFLTPDLGFYEVYDEIGRVSAQVVKDSNKASMQLQARPKNIALAEFLASKCAALRGWDGCEHVPTASDLLAFIEEFEESYEG